jgi:copper chaperone
MFWTRNRHSGGRQYQIEGHGCDHCADSVSENVKAVRGVERVEFDRGRLIVAGQGFSDQDVREAVEAAGQKVVR